MADNGEQIRHCWHPEVGQASASVKVPEWGDAGWPRSAPVMVGSTDPSSAQNMQRYSSVETGFLVIALPSSPNAIAVSHS